MDLSASPVGAETILAILEGIRAGVRPTEEVAAAASEAPATDEILAVLRDRAGPDRRIYAHPDIPQALLATALERCGVPRGETVLGLVDLTVLGSASNCLVVTTAGVRYANDFKGKTPSGALSFEALSAAPIRPAGPFDVHLGGPDYVETSGARCGTKAVAELLLALRAIAAARR